MTTTTVNTTAVPDGYMENGQGHMVPLEQVREIDRERDALVREIAAKAKAASDELATLKARFMADVQAFVELSLERYQVAAGGKKGNLTLLSYDGSLKVVRQMQEHMTFDEGLLAAKELIDACLREWTKGSPGEVRAIVDHAFQVDKEGKINTGRILGLRRLNITDERWQRAMTAIGESIQITGAKPYLRVYYRKPDGSYAPIPLDMAAL
ncbi:DUF3164 family protein [Nitratidesulfovibrio liaohensis]|uniref:DUF3164 family protein n=1 Tax=Nitratidesulfovibrio liaohensis TaxID=2604158 RepID=A0ABY9R5A0_9BACT|nr:DUF3164 family protein [Nitratidesulfovibrio liaohensis]WMW66634.1 DUF3164 family protein [Nitratidesulfovibrio liaohensis]